MKLAFYIARRYLVSKKSVNVINLISVISVIGVAIGTMALIVVLSVFNGIDFFVQDLLSNFDPDLKITVVEGKSFSIDAPGFDDVTKLEGVAGYARVIEENALLRYENSQKYAVVKGVEDDYATFTGLDSMLMAGQFVLEDDNVNYTVMGQGVANDLSVGMKFIRPVYIYYPEKEVKSQLSLESAFNIERIYPSGIFSVQQEIDNSYIIVPIEVARSVFGMEGKITSLELKLKKDADTDEVKKKVQQLLGARFLVQDRYQQHEFIYRVMSSEKWSSFLILSFILIIASFNLLGSLTMIIIDKKDDIHILESMGAGQKLIRQIFLFEGWLISVSGAVIGLVLGIALVFIQKNLELLRLPGSGSFAITAYPVQLQLTDVFATLAIVLGIGFFAAWYPVRSLKMGNGKK